MSQGLSRRRWVLVACSSALVAGCGAFGRKRDAINERLEAIRARVGGRLGVHVLDTHTGRRVRFDDESRYAMASTFKMLLAAAVLAKADRGELGIARALSYSSGDILPTSPVTSKHLAEGSLTIQELCAAIVEVSDNTAANLLLARIGGPTALTQFVRSLGDTVTRLDRTEMELNSNLPGDSRDTTSPRAMVGSMQKVFTGSVLSEASLNLLNGWMVSAVPGLKRIRAGIPKDWKAGDKAGTGARGAVNDVAILWPPGRKPILMAVYMSESTQPLDVLMAAHAEIAATIFSSEKAPTA